MRELCRSRRPRLGVGSATTGEDRQAPHTQEGLRLRSIAHFKIEKLSLIIQEPAKEAQAKKLYEWDERSTNRFVSNQSNFVN